MIDNIFGIAYFLIALGLIVLVHEFGHLIIAKRNNVHCYEFSVGMGPRISKLYTDKKGTEYSLRAIPLGGYVQMAGEGTSEIDEKFKKVSEENYLNNKSPFVRFKILIAGSIMNVILAIFIFFITAFLTGIPSNSNTVFTEEPQIISTDNKKEKITISEINGKVVNNFEEITSSLSQNEVEIKYKDEKQVEKVATISKKEDAPFLISEMKKSANPLTALKFALIMPFKIIALSVLSLYMLIVGSASVTDLSGPIGIYSMSSEITNYGFVAMISWIAFLSVSIGFTNLLPIPGLDGGHLLFVYYQMIFKKKAPKKVEETALTIGIIILLCLFAFTVINDTIRYLL